MSVQSEIKYAKLDDLFLDPINPRLGRDNADRGLSQEKVLDLMRDWNLDELAVSFLESGFWPQEAVLVVEEKLYDRKCLVVVEGNRRIAALILLRDVFNGKPISPTWAQLIGRKKVPSDLFEKIPYIIVDSRKDVMAFLGFRHVTGIEQWRPAEKAEYIAKLIDEYGFTYEQVMRKIGSRTSTVRQNYISYCLLLQMENQNDISIKNVEKEFSVLFLSLRTNGAQLYLDIDINADPAKAKKPVSPRRLKALTNYSKWLFGDAKTPPLFTDSRNVDKFGKILESDDAVYYLERTEKPNFDVAYRIAGGDEPELINLIEQAMVDKTL
jgi:ParB-like chromosome segregation protein Spo0J